jgi:hypothetical protein
MALIFPRLPALKKPRRLRGFLLRRDAAQAIFCCCAARIFHHERTLR